MKLRFILRFLSYFAVLSGALMGASGGWAQFSGVSDAASSALSIPQVQLIQADELNRLLKAGGAGNPVVLQVGSHTMYSQAHIPGSQFAGPGSQPDGLRLLASKVASLPKDKLIVIYCGCCPWNHCPNVGPAFQRLRELGFMRVKVLYVAHNFGADWVNKGYSVESGQ